MRCTGTISVSSCATSIAEMHGFGPVQKKFSGWVQEGRIGSEKIVLLKPRDLHE